jgi:hypothetical protein
MISSENGAGRSSALQQPGVLPDEVSEQSLQQGSKRKEIYTYTAPWVGTDYIICRLYMHISLLISASFQVYEK